MISSVSKVVVQVEDQDRAKDFWVNTMGFELVQDTPYEMGEGGGTRWIEVMPPDRRAVLVLSPPTEGQPSTIGTWSNVLFECDDIIKTHEELAERGVEFPEPPSKQFWGWWAQFRDSEGTMYGLGQREEG